MTRENITSGLIGLAFGLILAGSVLGAHGVIAGWLVLAAAVLVARIRPSGWYVSRRDHRES